jgi:hypothetical protein
MSCRIFLIAEPDDLFEQSGETIVNLAAADLSSRVHRNRGMRLLEGKAGQQKTNEFYGEKCHARGDERIRYRRSRR